jgi:hypothetical protein
MLYPVAEAFTVSSAPDLTAVFCGH